MIIKKKINKIFVLLLFNITLAGQTKPGVYKIDALLKRIHNNSDTVYIVNFWATWCKPCIEELPDFEKFHKQHPASPVKVLLVSIDFKEDMEAKLIPFLKKNNYSAECILLDEVNGNDFINKINVKWGGAIPATYFTTKNKRKEELFEKKISLEILNSALNGFLK